MAFCYVGEDVVMDILSRLPVKSILRFKSVCKPWCAIIKTHYFITKHLQRNLENLNVAPLFAISHENRGSIWWISEEEEVPSVDLDSPPFSNCTQSMIMGPVNGIYCEIRCVFDGEDELFLCNPSLREVKSLPEVTLPPMTHRPQPQGRGFKNIIFGFGYDSRSNDFKVVVVTCTEPNNFVFVYSLSSNSWRHFEHNTLLGFHTNHPQVFTSHGNGVVHNLSLPVEEERELSTPTPTPNYTNVILSFDLGTEVFKTLKLPPGVMIYTYPRRPDQFFYKDAQITTFFNDSIVLILKTTYHYNLEYYYEIFVMKEYGVEESWTKLYNVGPLLEVTRAFKVWKNGQILFTQEVVAEYHRGLVLFNPHSPQQMKDLHISSPFHVYSYMESLVSIN